VSPRVLEDSVHPRLQSGAPVRPLNFTVRCNLRVATLLTLCLLCACASSGNKVQDRQAYWERTVHTEVPLGTPKDAALKWAASRSINLTYSPESHDLHGPVEYVPVNDWACKGWSLTLILTLDSANTVASEAVKTYGNCL
jgi:hypothetical protein